MLMLSALIMSHCLDNDELLFGMHPMRMLMSSGGKRFIAECYGHNQHDTAHKCFFNVHKYSNFNN